MRRRSCARLADERAHSDSVSGHHFAILAAGIAAGALNAVVGSGTLITFPTLIGFGYAPVVANVSNTIGLVPGSIAGALGYRRELEGRRMLVLELLVASTLGGIAGAVLLLVLPASAFKRIVPAFIGIALVLVVIQPWLTRRLAERRPSERRPGRTPVALGALVATGIYGGYFGAAQGIILLGVLGATLRESLQQVNAIKNVLAGATNLVAGILFAASTRVDWKVALLIACGSVVGGWLGAHVGRRLPTPALRALIVGVGTFAMVKLLV
jgi:uncharacterized membrane protein YfcA